MGQQVRMTYVRLSIFEPQTEAKHNSNTFFFVLNMLPISNLTHHHLNAATATNSENLSANLNYPGKVYNCHDFHLWEYSGKTHKDMTGKHGVPMRSAKKYISKLKS